MTTWTTQSDKSTTWAEQSDLTASWSAQGDQSSTWSIEHVYELYVSDGYVDYGYIYEKDTIWQQTSDGATTWL